MYNILAFKYDCIDYFFMYVVNILVIILFDTGFYCLCIEELSVDSMPTFRLWKGELHNKFSQIHHTLQTGIILNLYYRHSIQHTSYRYTVYRYILYL